MYLKAILNRKAYLERKQSMKKFLEALEFIAGIALIIVTVYLVTKIRQQLGIQIGI